MTLWSAGFQSTPPVKAATRTSTAAHPQMRISIHAAREGGDRTISCDMLRSQIFQSTPPVKAATIKFYLLPSLDRTFQSTPPVKAATLLFQLVAAKTVFQSTPPVKAATFASVFKRSIQQTISIHAAREGGDTYRPQSSFL